ncbi:protein-methionine-sulfoxide reductase heme-binding subunit MsrQ [Cellvibrio fibrivorans]|uniref:Protein-methionine-sulfoxide reductase heme-binding subunit MsrQ n=1 Tax=Cellvibrio fibrivorans TaxID=126350 RepID=A0ABU1UVE6_9GAMM|nr:protein-methionine-sulfoxide reductase heme-binding subunit MsrQ [Cellvibrio fibrivorans]MDR7089083.1 sulfoxide reductase heme-binding subunit YedZ [Cellvibrio fibrivorans]
MPVLWRRVLIFFLALIPLVFIVYKTLANQLGADPAKTIVLFTGEWTIYFLFITLAVTPLRRLVNFTNFHFRWLQIHRRMLGLFTLFYAILHVLAFLVFILGLDFSRFGKELVERPYILVTIPAVILLIALGVTSTKAMMRRLGKNWLRLHKSIYLIAILAWVHVLMQVRSSYFEAVLFGVILLALLLPRLYWAVRK